MALFVALDRIGSVSVKPRVTRLPVSVICATYNERDRIAQFLRHALLWADEVLIVDKSSTDGTPDIAQSLGATVISVPYSPAGAGDPAPVFAAAKHAWCFAMTAGEVPTRSLIETAGKVIASAPETLGMVYLPKRIYSFGIHHEHSPWGLSYQPFLVHRERVEIREDIHNNFRLRDGFHHVAIPFERGHILHPTHATVSAFLRSHFDYILEEVRVEKNPQTAINTALQTAQMAQQMFAIPDLRMQALAWNIYFSGVALAWMEKARNTDVPTQYSNLRNHILDLDWNE